MEKDYLAVMAGDLEQFLTPRPLHLLRYLASIKEKSTFIYRTSRSNVIAKVEREGNLETVKFLFPSFFYALSPICGVVLFLYLIFFDRSRYKVGIALGIWSGITCFLLKKAGRIQKYVYEDVDYVPGDHKNLDIRKIVYVSEKWCVKTADLVVSVGELLAQLRRKQGAKKAIVIPNGVLHEIFSKAHLKKPHPPTMVFVGTIVAIFGLEVPIRALPKILEKYPETRFIIIGRGPHETSLRELVKTLGLEHHVIFTGAMRQDEVPEYLAESDVGVATFVRNDTTFFAFPMKIVEYIAAGLPIISTRVGEAARLVQELDAGKVIEYSPEEFTSAFNDIISNREKTSGKSAENAALILREYEWRSLFKKEFDIINSLFTEEDV